jgi:WD40 repeat protein
MKPMGLHAAALVDCAGVSPSPLFFADGPYQQLLQGSSSAAVAAHPAVPTLVRCSWLVGVNASAHGSLLWLRQRGLVAHAAGTVLVLTDLASHKQRHLQHHSQPISAAAASCDGSLLATAPAGAEPVSGCAEVCVWDAAACTLRFVLRQHASGVGLLAFSPDNCWLVSVSGSGAGGLLVLWDLQAGDAAAIGKTQKVSMRVLFTCCACHLSFQMSAQPAETSFVSQQ